MYFSIKPLRTVGINRLRHLTGLPLSPYFSASKITYLLENFPDIRRDAEKGLVLFGTIDSFLIWKLTDGHKHVTDVSNASRTMLMNIQTLAWDNELLRIFEVPRTMLPKICPSSDPTSYGVVSSTDVPSLVGVRITGVLGDQQAALFGQGCFHPGEAKCTYGTGAFLLLNIGEKIIHSSK